jgi:hypothetical protein
MAVIEHSGSPDETDVTSAFAPIARHVVRGVARLLVDLDYAVVAEVELGNGRRADVLGLDRQGRIAIVEVKSSLADFRADRKWQQYLPYCDAFLFAVPPEFPRHALPADAGLIVADRHQGVLVRWPPERALAAARRKAVTLRFARTAAARLHVVRDPWANAGGRAPGMR